MIAIPRKTFYFIRHGETDWNKNHMLMGIQDIPLNESGREQAEHAAYVMQEIEFSQVYTSPLSRALETATIISKICLIDVKIVKDLHERAMGSAEGKKKEEKIFKITEDEHLPKDAEKSVQFRKRVLTTLASCLSEELQDPLIVSHGGVFQVLVAALTNITNVSIENGEIFCFTPSVITKDKWDLIKLERKSN